MDDADDGAVLAVDERDREHVLVEVREPRAAAVVRALVVQLELGNLPRAVDEQLDLLGVRRVLEQLADLARRVLRRRELRGEGVAGGALAFVQRSE